MTGETVTVRRRTATGEDAMGDPIVEWEEEEVTNVLAMSATDSARGDITPHRTEASMTFSFPKGYTPSLRECEIAYGGSVYKVLGDPKPLTEDLCPTQWNYTVEAATVDG